MTKNQPSIRIITLIEVSKPKKHPLPQHRDLKTIN